MAACIGVDLRPIQHHRAHLEHSHLARQQQHLDEQRLDLLEKPSPECGDGVVVGMIVRGNEAEGDGIVGGSFQFASRKCPSSVACIPEGSAAPPGRHRPNPNRDSSCSSRSGPDHPPPPPRNAPGVSAAATRRPRAASRSWSGGRWGESSFYGGIRRWRRIHGASLPRISDGVVVRQAAQRCNSFGS